jgi:competence protein ComGC
MTVGVLFQIQSDLIAQLPVEAAEKVQAEQGPLLGLFVAQLLLFVGGIAASLVLAAHRIAGPHVAIKRTCNALRAGKASTRLHFRKYDKLEDVEECFNAMVDALQRMPTGTPAEQAESTPASKMGMTLVEVLIVCMIVGLLATIAIPTFTRPREKTRATLCIHNLRVLENAKVTWALENGKSGGDTPLAAELDGLLKGGTERMRCPSAGNIGGFSEHYSIGDVDARPACLILPDTHTL